MSLEKKLIEWYERPEIKAKGWLPRLFWTSDGEHDHHLALKVDGRELEVLFATILNEPSEYKDILNNEKPGRGTFLSANAKRHELPLLTRAPK